MVIASANSNLIVLVDHLFLSGSNWSLIKSRFRFKTKCCNYAGLVLATPVKTVVLQTDEEFTGGAYVRNEGLGGFDVIKEVKRRVMRNGV